MTGPVFSVVNTGPGAHWSNAEAVNRRQGSGSGAGLSGVPT